MSALRASPKTSPPQFVQHQVQYYWLDYFEAPHRRDTEAAEFPRGDTPGFTSSSALGSTARVLRSSETRPP